MWAMMPMFRVLFKGACLGIFVLLFAFFHQRRGPPPARTYADASPRIRMSSARHGRRRSPSVMRERLVRFRHSMGILALFDRAATQVRRVQEFVRQLLL